MSNKAIFASSYFSNDFIKFLGKALNFPDSVFEEAAIDFPDILERNNVILETGFRYWLSITHNIDVEVINIDLVSKYYEKFI